MKRRLRRSAWLRKLAGHRRPLLSCWPHGCCLPELVSLADAWIRDPNRSTSVYLAITVGKARCREPWVVERRHCSTLTSGEWTWRHDEPRRRRPGSARRPRRRGVSLAKQIAARPNQNKWGLHLAAVTSEVAQVSWSRQAGRSVGVRGCAEASVRGPVVAAAVGSGRPCAARCR